MSGGGSKAGRSRDGGASTRARLRRGAAASLVAAALAAACNGGGGSCLSLTGCGEGCSSPAAGQAWRAVFTAESAAIVDPGAPVLEARITVGRAVNLLLVPVGAQNVCSPEATWASTNPGVAAFEAGNPSAGTKVAPFGDAVLHGIAPGSASITVNVAGREYGLYSGRYAKSISVVHVVP
jgi:hypothetical protein